jgi:hypothetical protein
MEYNLLFRKTKEIIKGYADADLAGDKTDRLSYSGYVFMLGGGAVSWVSRKQKSVSLSTAKSEYVASEAVKEALSLRNLLKGILRKDFTIPIYKDNKSAVKFTSDETSLKKIRHIDIRYHFIRECSQNENINLQFLPSEDMVADIFTKGLTRCRHNFCVSELGLVNGT